MSKDVLTMAAVKTSSAPRKNHPWRRIFGWLFENTLLGRFFFVCIWHGPARIQIYHDLPGCKMFSPAALLLAASSCNFCKDPLVNRHVMFYEAGIGLMWPQCFTGLKSDIFRSL
jgi:hypothetical protein